MPKSSVKTQETNDERKGGEKSKKTWQLRLNECKAFRQKFGHCRIPTKYKENKQLGIWVQEQRRKYKCKKQDKKCRGRLSREQIDLLNEIGFSWESNSNSGIAIETDEEWEINFDRLEEYKNNHGSFDIPNSEETAELVNWTRVQRYLYHASKRTNQHLIAEERVGLLDEIGFNWDGCRMFKKRPFSNA